MITVSSRCRYLLIAILLVATPFFFIGGPGWAAGPLYRASWDLGHILFFAILTLAWQLWRGAGGWRQWLTITGLVLVAGIVIETLQTFVGREVHWNDILRNLIGAWLVLAWRQPVAGHAVPVRLTIWLARFAAIVLLAFQVAPVASVAIQQYRLAHQLPVLAEFNEAHTLPYWSGNVGLTQEYVAEGDQSLAIHLDTGRYSGVSLNNMPRNWRGYSQLGFQLYNPSSTAVSLTLRISDLQHDRGTNAYNDRFNTRIQVQPGWNRYRFELAAIAGSLANRRMDLDQVRRLGLFSSNLPQPLTLYLDELRLF